MHRHAQALNYFGYDAYRKAFERAAGQDGLGNRARLCAGALAGKHSYSDPCQLS
jgi:hypothetical protein